VALADLGCAVVGASQLRFVTGSPARKISLPILETASRACGVRPLRISEFAGNRPVGF
jgi:hypothetical protein